MFYFLQIFCRATMRISNNLLKNKKKLSRWRFYLNFLTQLLILLCSTAHLPHPSSSTLYTVCGSSGSSHPPHHVQFGPDAPDAALPPPHHLPDAHLLQHQPTAQDLVETAHRHREVRWLFFFCLFPTRQTYKEIITIILIIRPRILVFLSHKKTGAWMTN